MIHRILILSVASVLLISCVAVAPSPTRSRTVPAKLYNLTTGEVYDATFHFAGETHGLIDFTLPSGEHFTGQYNTVRGGSISWGRIYGNIYTYSQTLPTEYRGVAIVTSERNRYLHCEYTTNRSRDETHGHGACVDNDGIMYRLMW